MLRACAVTALVLAFATDVWAQSAAPGDTVTTLPVEGIATTPPPPAPGTASEAVPDASAAAAAPLTPPPPPTLPDATMAPSGPPTDTRRFARVSFRAEGPSHRLAVDAVGVRRRRDDPHLFACNTPCEVLLEPGPYRLQSTPEGGVTGNGRFDVWSPGVRVVLTQPRSRVAPLATLVGGAALAIAGLEFAILGALNYCVFNPCPPMDSEGFVAGGISMIAVGVVGIVVSVWTLGRSGHSIGRVERIAE